MLCIKNLNTDPFFNLAAEEFMLKNFREDCFMLYRNENAIIIGKHQNALSEINTDVVEEKAIHVVRRISGGGTVFHDLGNLNFAFIAGGKEGNLVDFKRFTTPVMKALASMGLNAEWGKRNDLLINGRKFSGNAEHVWKNRTLHHGTLLFSSELEDLSSALKVNPLRFSDKAVKSVRSRVANISGLLDMAMDIFEFRDRIMDHVLEMYEDARLYEFSNSEIREIKKLSDEKFKSWEWNFGYSPRYTFSGKLQLNNQELHSELIVEKGIIMECRIFSADNKSFFPELFSGLKGLKHDKKEIKGFLSRAENEKFLNEFDISGILKLFY